MIVQAPERRRLIVRTRNGYLAGLPKPGGRRCALRLGDGGCGANEYCWDRQPCLAWWGIASLQAARYQHEKRVDLERIRAASPTVSDSSELASGSLIGSLDIPRLRLSAMIAEGDDDATLNVAIGHLSDTPLPCHEGNSALAGQHRDTFFRPLQHIRVGDELRVSTVRGDFLYQVRETMVGVRMTCGFSIDGPTLLTLITCYPFNYVGKAPRRFIVRAERTSNESSAVVVGKQVD